MSEKNASPRKTLSRLVLLLTFLIIKINEYDVVAGELVDPLYRLPSECVSVLETISQKRRKLSTT